MEKMVMWIISLVALVAIVGMVTVFTGVNKYNASSLQGAALAPKLSVDRDAPVACTGSGCANPQPIVTCTDTDEGINYLTYGEVTSGTKFSQDICQGGWLYERYCANGTNYTSYYMCNNLGSNYVCQNGACAQIATTCTDTDPLNDIYLFGIVNMVNSSGNFTRNDSCSGNTVDQFSCNGNYIGFTYSSCPFGCSNGVCLTNQTNTTCTNECTGPVCSGTGYKACGNYDADLCSELNTVVTPCADTVCREPNCSNGVCGSSLVANGGTDEACYSNTGCTGGNCYCNGVGNCYSKALNDTTPPNSSIARLTYNVTNITSFVDAWCYFEEWESFMYSINTTISINEVPTYADGKYCGTSRYCSWIQSYTPSPGVWHLECAGTNTRGMTTVQTVEITI
ncbi:hypothetical protein C4573_00750 [Candidatus Woesearchaeota archaeon]|nr:MAG: hypothetical protein C4573_00750 [Candidatus Woesearchaeota archaeon]